MGLLGCINSLRHGNMLLLVLLVYNAISKLFSLPLHLETPHPQILYPYHNFSISLKWLYIFINHYHYSHCIFSSISVICHKNTSLHQAKSPWTSLYFSYFLDWSTWYHSPFHFQIYQSHNIFVHFFPCSPLILDKICLLWWKTETLTFLGSSSLHLNFNMLQVENLKFISTLKWVTLNCVAFS